MKTVREDLKMCAAALCAFLAGLRGQRADGVTLQIKVDQITARVSPIMYGLMTEEINYSYDGGLYGELVRNRNFKEDAKAPVHWQLGQERGGSGSMVPDATEPLNDVVRSTRKLTVSQVSGDQKVGVANQGFYNERHS